MNINLGREVFVKVNSVVRNATDILNIKVKAEVFNFLAILIIKIIDKVGVVIDLAYVTTNYIG